MINRDLLAIMLADQDGATANGTVWTIKGDLDALISGEGGAPMPLRKVRAITLGEAYLTLETDEMIWRLPHPTVLGIRGHISRTKTNSRTGFAT